MTTTVFNDCPATHHSVERVEMWIGKIKASYLHTFGSEIEPIILCNNGVCEYALESEK